MQVEAVAPEVVDDTGALAQLPPELHVGVKGPPEV
jgi:hypothetical protein